MITEVDVFLRRFVDGTISATWQWSTEERVGALLRLLRALAISIPPECRDSTMGISNAARDACQTLIEIEHGKLHHIRDECLCDLFLLALYDQQAHLEGDHISFLLWSWRLSTRVVRAVGAILGTGVYDEKLKHERVMAWLDAVISQRPVLAFTFSLDETCRRVMGEDSERWRKVHRLSRFARHPRHPGEASTGWTKYGGGLANMCSTNMVEVA